MLRLAAQPSRQIGNGADRGVIHRPFKSNGSNRGIASRDANSGTEINTARSSIHFAMSPSPAAWRAPVSRLARHDWDTEEGH